jgi:hypothetical protein
LGHEVAVGRGDADGDALAESRVMMIRVLRLRMISGRAKLHSTR